MLVGNTTINFWTKAIKSRLVYKTELIYASWRSCVSNWISFWNMIKCNICRLCPKAAGEYMNSLQKELDKFQATFLFTSQAFDKVHFLSHLWKTSTCSHSSLFSSMQMSFIPIAYEHIADGVLWVLSDHYHFPTLVALPL